MNQTDSKLLEKIQLLILDWHNAVNKLPRGKTYGAWVADEIMSKIEEHDETLKQKLLDRANESVNGALYVGLGRERTMEKLSEDLL